jgi:hypothetical protein
MSGGWFIFSRYSYNQCLKFSPHMVFGILVASKRISLSSQWMRGFNVFVWPDCFLETLASHAKLNWLLWSIRPTLASPLTCFLFTQQFSSYGHGYEFVSWKVFLIYMVRWRINLCSSLVTKKNSLPLKLGFILRKLPQAKEDTVKIHELNVVYLFNHVFNDRWPSRFLFLE